MAATTSLSGSTRVIHSRGHSAARFAGQVLLHAFVLALAIAFLVPTAWLISSSFKASTEIFAHPIRWVPDTLIWQNYVDAFTTLPLGRFAINTGIVVALAVSGTLVSATMVAYSFARLRWPGRDLFFALLLATMMLPEVVTLVPKFILFRWLGWVGTFLPLTVPFWFGGTPFYVFLLRQFLRGLPYELEEAARIDGAGTPRILVQVVLPLCRPVLATVAVFSTLTNYNDFLHPLIYLSRMENWTLALGIRAFNDTFASRWELIFAAATVMLMPIAMLFFLAQRQFVAGIQLTGLGGR
ncbi:MAG: carbohydrate ABC transporter permease [Chloroflexi bacterium]|nr:carbohydrate ABC transporter permease [Chloroflexota bacterium]